MILHRNHVFSRPDNQHGDLIIHHRDNHLYFQHVNRMFNQQTDPLFSQLDDHFVGQLFNRPDVLLRSHLDVQCIHLQSNQRINPIVIQPAAQLSSQLLSQRKGLRSTHQVNRLNYLQSSRQSNHISNLVFSLQSNHLIYLPVSQHYPQLHNHFKFHRRTQHINHLVNQVLFPVQCRQALPPSRRRYLLLNQVCCRLSSHCKFQHQIHRRSPV